MRNVNSFPYKARQQSLKCLVALEVLPPSLSEDPIARKRFAREISVIEDGAAAHGLYEKACGMGSAAGCGSLAPPYLDGIFVKKDAARALELYKTGCDGGYEFASTGLGVMYEQNPPFPSARF